jgi:hypothetical protein
VLGAVVTLFAVAAWIVATSSGAERPVLFASSALVAGWAGANSAAFLRCESVPSDRLASELARRTRRHHVFTALVFLVLALVAGVALSN